MQISQYFFNVCKVRSKRTGLYTKTPYFRVRSSSLGRDLVQLHSTVLSSFGRFANFVDK